MDHSYQEGTCVPLAVTGLAFEFPDDAVSSGRFWKMICDGRSTSREFPSNRLNIDGYYHPDDSRPSSIPLRGGHFVEEELGAFDAPFFAITPGEAACMDPQHRRMLEVSYHALENAGVPIHKCIGSETSVYTGCFTNDYLSILQQDLEAEQRHAIMGIAPSMLANRVSWFFNFKGTSMNLDSACSSSLVALHLACQDLRAGNCSMALVGGANLVYHPNFMKMMTDFNFLSKDSRSWSFDARANGYARGEGHAVIVIKRLSDALKDGDNIRTIIRNTGSNQDGRTPGITQPSGEAQVDLIRHTYRQAGIDMEPTRFFEAHGTGTPVGDPIEAKAIGTAFYKYRSKDDPLFVGAVKANIGHLEGCSGLAGIIKTILVLENGIIPPVAGLSSLNPKIHADEWHLNFPTKLTPWPVSTLRRACINSFGFGGTNAAVILDDAHNFLRLNGLHGFHWTNQGQSSSLNIHDMSSFQANNHNSSKPKILVWSAPDQQGAQRLQDAYCDYLIAQPRDLSALAYTLTERRSQFSWRSFAVASSLDAASIESTILRKPTRAAEDPRIAFVFTGQGAQYLGMGRSLIDFEVFRVSIETSDKYLKDLGCRWSLLDVFTEEDECFAIDSPGYSQPLTTSLQIALVDLLRSFGILPSVVLGHSSGEITAAYACGALSHFSAVKVSYHRGTLSAHLLEETKNPKMAMLAVGLSSNDVDIYLSRLGSENDTPFDVQIGCVNSPKSITLTGNATLLGKLDKLLKEEGIFSRILRVPIAYHHSHFMSQIADAYLSAIGDAVEVGSRETTILMISSVTGNVISHETLSRGIYWVRNLTSPVGFESAFSLLALQAGKRPRQILGKSIGADLRATHVLEIGPHSTLRGPIQDIRQQLADSGANLSSFTYIPLLLRNNEASVTVLNAVGEVWCSGLSSIDMLSVNCLDNSPRATPAGMPPYPFDHSQIHWNEGRLSRNLRFRQTPRHELLGTRNLDWNPEVAQWRNIIRLAEVPWLKDHTIDGQVVFPAAGMVAMAIEALMQLLGGINSLQAVCISDTAFSHAIVFPAGLDHVEVQLSLTAPLQRSQRQAFEFRLSVVENDKYVQCCCGMVRSISKMENQIHAVPSRSWPNGQLPSTWLDNIFETCQEPGQGLYTTQKDSAINYGPSFQNLELPRFGRNGEAVALLNTECWKSKVTESFDGPTYIIHPSTLDGLAQLLVPAISHQLPGEDIPTMMPTRIGSLWIKNVSNVRKGKIEVAGQFWKRGFRGAVGDIVAIDDRSNSPIVVLNGLETTFIGSSGVLSSQILGHKARGLCHRLVSKPDISLMDHNQLLAHCTRERPQQHDEVVIDRYWKITAIYTFIYDALEFLEQHPSIGLNDHIRSFIDWMRYQVHKIRQRDCQVDANTIQGLLNDPIDRERLVVEIESSSIEGKLLMTLGRNLPQIISSTVDPLELMTRDGLLDQYYTEMLANDHHAYPACEFLGLLSHQNPSLKILEVGAGTGGITSRLLQAMSTDGILKWGKYDYTDISLGFLGAARSKFQHYSSLMDFKLCNIADATLSPSFEAGSYDLIIASHVLHAVENLDQSLSNIRNLLKPDGKLLLLETTEPDAIEFGFAFGLLQDWWRPLENEIRSPHSPCLTSKQWDERLRAAGFSGVDVDIPGQDNISTTSGSIIISSLVSPRHLLPEIVVLVDDSSEAQQAVARCLSLTLYTETCQVLTLCQLAEMQINDDAIIVFLLELDLVFLHGISEHNYICLNNILRRSNNILWVTRSLNNDEPFHRLVEGLSRALMSEDSNKKFSTLGLDEGHQCPDSATAAISKVVSRMAEHPIESIENIVSAQGLLHTNRMTANHPMDTIITNANSTRHIQQCQITQCSPLELYIRSPGKFDTLEWRGVHADGARSEQLLDDEVLVQTRAVGLSRKDYAIAMGELDEAALGTDISGVVLSAGANCGFMTGDPVFSIASSTPKSVMKCKAESLARIPPHLSFAEAASLPTSLWVAYHGLMNIARLQRGDAVLIHQGASCVGQMAIQLAKCVGAKVLVTATSTIKSKVLQEVYGVSAVDILCAGHDDFISDTFRWTQGRGIDVIMASLEDDDEAAFFSKCLAPLGRLINTKAGSRLSWLTGGPARNPDLSNATQASVNLAHLLVSRPQTAYKVFHEAIEAAFSQQLTPPRPLHTFQAHNLEAAFSHFHDRKVIGKRVIELNQNDKVVASFQTKPSHIFLPSASYVVAGGFGGLGRSIVRWMAGRGARYLIILSRSGAATPSAKDLVSELESSGVSVATPTVDIGALDQLQTTLVQLQHSMPPIRGCVQATVTLRDNLWDNMSFDDWVVSTNSKVSGSWNLHAALPSNLDFFVLMSSVNGIFGNRSQANYSAGNTFKDALAHYRISHGQKAISIDLGLMVDEGMVAENDELLSSMRRIGHLVDIRMDELLSLLEYYCDPRLPLLSHGEAQVLVGIETPAATVAKGVDLHHSIHRAIFSHLFAMPGDENELDLVAVSNGSTKSRPEMLRNIVSDVEAASLVQEWLKTKIGQLLGLQTEDVNLTRPAHTYGIDSLVAIDLKNWFAREIGVEIQIFTLLGNETLEDLGKEAGVKSRFRGASG
ncbi:lovastatin nonaketide synthase [Hypoxylon sp. NC1633]|nr:lovastatin nonaketide synthase [Hypoxylon sp. NC1633]